MAIGVGDASANEWGAVMIIIARAGPTERLILMAQ
ncbi:MAG: hypothetical protein RL467_781 [Actinomycetota bacterium]|jgi:hypothetical protein